MRNKRADKAGEFLRAMNLDPVAEEAPRPAIAADQAPPEKQDKPKPGTRIGRTHIGGYLDRETVEKVAVLRVRLSLDNSQLIKLAIDELHRKHLAQRSFGDV